MTRERRRYVLISVLVLAFMGWGLWSTARSRQVAHYCQYGSVSRSQYEGCIDHVSYGDVQDSDSNAARYARDELDECLEDAGPMCSDADTEPLLEP